MVSSCLHKRFHPWIGVLFLKLKHLNSPDPLASHNDNGHVINGFFKFVFFASSKS
jgi:hypothetical protein